MPERAFFDMKTFIFGAGASKASQETYQPDVIAPLANELFNRDYQGFASAVGVETTEIEKFRTSIPEGVGLEDWLTKKWESHDGLKTIASKISNRSIFGRITCYIWWLMQNVSQTYNVENGYKLLLEKLEAEDEQRGFINFNYDTLLDRALMGSGANLVNGLAGYSNSDYVKPHGSVNWFLKKRGDDPNISPGEQSHDHLSRFRLAANNMYSPQTIPMNLEVLDPSHIDLNSPNIIASGKFGHQYGYPFILVPLTSKLYGHFESYKDQILTEAQRLASNADEIYLIGYQARDEIVKEILAITKPDVPLHVVGNGHAKDLQREVLSWQPLLKEGKTFDGGFMEFAKTYEQF